MTPSQLKPPSRTTLRKYGITEDMWYNYLDVQDWKCPVCGREFSEDLRPVIDHFHARGFKKMKPEQKRRYTRGLLCSYCNLRRVGRGITTQIAYNTYLYLKSYDDRSKNEFQ